ncbi:MAG: ATP-binding cassette domain-containing protein [Tepidanaerobacteraceae bacterium]|jgi:ABC-2 type transport system ATP-binding protein|nr:ATP-binding cassette domain-containing protein [Tepidanaerobacteraceae bacterium]
MDKIKSEYAVEVAELVKVFDKKKAVDGISFTIRTGTICGLLGPNGAGKTTTINMLATLLKPDAGTAKIFGYDVTKETQKVRQLIGLTGQYATIDESLTAMENLKIFARLLGFSRTDAKRKAEELLEEFSLTEAANRKVSMFSGGMRRRLDLAASLLASPPLIFLDEPTTGLDPRTRAQMWQTIRTLVKNGSTILLTTQYLDEADQLADDIVVINKGKVVAHDTPAGLKRSVSASSLQLTVKNPDCAPKAAQITERVLGGKAQVSEAAEVTIPLADTAKLADVLVKLKEMEIDIAAINVREPSLDEVFFALTGDKKEAV